MRYKIIMPLSILFCINAVSAGAQEQELELKDLNIPNSPAFSILDYSPTVIDKPGTAKAFSASLLSIAGEASGIPKNFAIEVSPFWFFKNRLNAYRYMGIDSGTGKQKNIFTNIRNASFSIGSVFRDSSNTQPFNANYLSGGLRLNLITIARNGVAREIHAVMGRLAKKQAELISPVVASCLGSGLMPNTPAYNTCLANGLVAAFEGNEEYKSYETELQKLMAVKPLFQFEMAYAVSWTFRDNSFSDHHSYRSGIWGTVNFNYPLGGKDDINKLYDNKNYLNLYITGRYLSEELTPDFKNFERQRLLDIGGRLELELNRFSLSFESLRRFNQTNKDFNTNRNVGIVQYKVSEKLFLIGTFGKNFGPYNNLLALFGINWGFGKQSLIE